MNFLSLTSLQAALLSLFTTAVIVALYFLKHRSRRIVVSSTQLWRKVIERQLENSLFEKLRRVLSVLLAVIMGLLIALAFARPEIERLTGRAKRIVVVLDTSASMLARSNDGRTRWQHAVDAAQGLLAQGGVRTEFRIVDTAGQFDSPFMSDRKELHRTIERIRPVIASTRFPRVDSTPRADNVYFITDGVSSLRPPANVSVMSVFDPAPNVGVTAFEVRSMPSTKLAYEAYLEVFNAGKEGRSVEITVSGAGQQRITRKVRIDSGRSFRDALDVSQFEGGGIRASVRSDGDALSLDDVAYAYLPIKRRTRTLLVTRGNPLLESVLKLDSLVELSVTDPKNFNAGADVDAFVFDRFAPTDPPTRPALIIGAQDATWLRRSAGAATKPSFQSWMEDHPVMRHVSLFDVRVDSAARIDARNLSVLAASGDVPLIVASERPRWVMLTFNLDSSDFPYHAGFPLFIDNTLAWFDRERLALRRSPGIVDVPIAGAQVRDIDGRSIPSRDHGDGISFEARDPGLYVAAKGDVRQYIAANFASRQYSDINNSHVRETKTASLEKPLVRRELWFYMLLAASFLFGVEWYTYHRRITV